MKDIGEYKEILKEHINPNKWNPNVMTDDEKKRLKTSVDRNGMLQTVLLYENSETDYTIIDGEHRWLNADDKTKIRSIVLKESDLATIKSNLEKKEGIIINNNEDILKHLTVIMNKLRGNATPTRLGELIESLSVEETSKANLMLMDNEEIQFYSLIEEIEEEKKKLHEKEMSQDDAEFIKWRVKDVTGLKSVILNIKDKEFLIDGEKKELESMTMTVNGKLQTTLNCRYKDIDLDDGPTPTTDETGTDKEGSDINTEAE